MSREIKFRAWDNGMYEEILVCPDGAWTDNIVHDVWHSGNIMQFTGLLDKNGKEIYEGDVVRSKPYLAVADEMVISQVLWSDSRARWEAEEIHPKYNDIEILFEVCKEPHETEIIGNIYENPELLNP